MCYSKIISFFILKRLQNFAECGENSVLTLYFLCLPCCDTVKGTGDTV